MSHLIIALLVVGGFQRQFSQLHETEVLLPVDVPVENVPLTCGECVTDAECEALCPVIDCLPDGGPAFCVPKEGK